MDTEKDGKPTDRSRFSFEISKDGLSFEVESSEVTASIKGVSRHVSNLYNLALGRHAEYWDDWMKGFYDRKRERAQAAAIATQRTVEQIPNENLQEPSDKILVPALRAIGLEGDQELLNLWGIVLGKSMDDREEIDPLLIQGLGALRATDTRLLNWLMKDIFEPHLNMPTPQYGIVIREHENGSRTEISYKNYAFTGQAIFRIHGSKSQEEELEWQGNEADLKNGLSRLVSLGFLKAFDSVRVDIGGYSLSSGPKPLTKSIDEIRDEMSAYHSDLIPTEMTLSLFRTIASNRTKAT